jgi:hypothetical protein
MTAAAFWWVHTVTVETYEGVGANGATKLAAPVSVECWVEPGNKLVRNADGAEVVSSSSIHGPLDQSARFVVGSKVTVAGDGSRRVLALERFDSGELGLNLEHFVAHLT